MCWLPCVGMTSTRLSSCPFDAVFCSPRIDLVLAAAIQQSNTVLGLNPARGSPMAAAPLLIFDECELWSLCVVRASSLRRYESLRLDVYRRQSVLQQRCKSARLSSMKRMILSRKWQNLYSRSNNVLSLKLFEKTFHAAERVFTIWVYYARFRQLTTCMLL